MIGGSIMDISKLQNRQFHSQAELGQALQELYEQDKQEYTRQCGDSQQFRIIPEEMWTFLSDCIQEAGNLDMIYFIQDMWAARKVYESGVKHIYDIGSRVEGYISHLLSMNVQVTMLDIRPLNHNIEGLHFIRDTKPFL